MSARIAPSAVRRRVVGIVLVVPVLVVGLPMLAVNRLGSWATGGVVDVTSDAEPGALWAADEHEGTALLAIADGVRLAA